jgi:HAE1 family hydrophobic/amphiphilic exporter-1
MATVAIVLGMMPMALGIGSSGVEFRQPMGLVSIGGMIISTALGLFVIPAFYYLFSKSKTVKING